MQNLISSGDDEKSQNICYVQKKNQDPFFRTGLCTFFKLSWNHERSTPQIFETNEIAERAVRREKEGTSSVFVHSGLQETGGQKPWSATAISDMYKSFWQKAKRLVNDGSLHHSMGRLFRLEQK